MDLGRLQLTDLRLDIGIGETEITMPRRGILDANINGGIGELTILIPSSMAAKIDVDTGIGQVEVEGDFERDDDSYISPDFERSDHRITLDVDSGIGSVHIRQLASE